MINFIYVYVSSLAIPTHPRQNRLQRKTYMNVHANDDGSDDNFNISCHIRFVVLAERDLLVINNDIELQYNNGVEADIAFSPPIVTTGIFAGHDTHEPTKEKNRYEG